ncbi:hypothetical protein [Methylobacterium sp. 174MFSha1.1]|uniref:hypothetical protein n=1 Tax=Methylobacterium sp. 174MFSha1.1 TaxID=1502749 RepID=UPI0011606BA1|nr:hypothetical protein [Methylobacterium sp. 174MFSha1.1]
MVTTYCECGHIYKKPDHSGRLGMPSQDIELLVVSLAKSKAYRIFRESRSLSIVSMIVDVDKKSVNSIGETLKKVMQTLDRYEINGSIDNLAFISSVAGNIEEWERSAADSGAVDFCQQLSDLRYFLFAIVKKDESPEIITHIYESLIKPIEEHLKSENIERSISSAPKAASSYTRDHKLVKTINNDEDQILVHNETTKITANAITSTAVGLYVGGVVLPMIAVTYPLPSAPTLDFGSALLAGIWSLSALWLHYLSRDALGDLKA